MCRNFLFDEEEGKVETLPFEKSGEPKMKIRRLLLPALLCFAMSSCATNHLLRWSRGEQSLFSQPGEDAAPYVIPAGTVLALPVTAAWDILTFPFQFLWDVHPFGPTMAPGTPETDHVSDQ